MQFKYMKEYVRTFWKMYNENTYINFPNGKLLYFTFEIWLKCKGREGFEYAIIFT